MKTVWGIFGQRWGFVRAFGMHRSRAMFFTRLAAERAMKDASDQPFLVGATPRPMGQLLTEDEAQNLEREYTARYRQAFGEIVEPLQNFCEAVKSGGKVNYPAHAAQLQTALKVLQSVMGWKNPSSSSLDALGIEMADGPEDGEMPDLDDDDGPEDGADE